MASISADHLGGGKYKVRWREWQVQDGVRKRVSRSRTVVGTAARDELMVAVRHALDTKGYWVPEAKPEELVCNLEQAALAWVRHKTARGLAPGTVKGHAYSMSRWFKTIRQLHGLRDDQVVPGSVMTRDSFTSAVLEWKKDDLSDNTLYGYARAVFEMWCWVADDPDAWPGVPQPPRDSSHVMPPAPLRPRPGIAPSWDEMDAIIRRAAARAAQGGNYQRGDLHELLAVLRFTGLRISQVHGIRLGDLDAEQATLFVRVGKSKREKIDQRVVPISRHLVNLLAPRLQRLRDSEGALFPSPRSTGFRKNGSHPLMKELWEQATAAGEVRREVWWPRGKRQPRPNHAFRAGFLSSLEAPGEVKDYLVGHAPKTTRETYYARPSEDALRAAVDSIPPIDWGDGGSNVLRLHG